MNNTKLTPKEIIAARIAKEFKDGDVANLGIGLPTMVPRFLPDNVDIILESENGYLGLGPLGEVDPDLVDAGGQPSGIIKGASFFDSAFSFGLIRGGHIDIAVLGGLEVDSHGNLANWMVPGKLVPGMGGAMDLVVGAKKIIIAMEHTTKDGAPRILNKCNLPLTGEGVVDMVVTELAIFSVTDEGFVLEELQEGITMEMVKEKTEADFKISPTIKNLYQSN